MTSGPVATSLPTCDAGAKEFREAPSRSACALNSTFKWPPVRRQFSAPSGAGAHSRTTRANHRAPHQPFGISLGKVSPECDWHAWQGAALGSVARERDRQIRCDLPEVSGRRRYAMYFTEAYRQSHGRMAMLSSSRDSHLHLGDADFRAFDPLPIGGLAEAQELPVISNAAQNLAVVVESNPPHW